MITDISSIESISVNRFLPQNGSDSLYKYAQVIWTRSPLHCLLRSYLCTNGNYTLRLLKLLSILNGCAQKASNFSTCIGRCFNIFFYIHVKVKSVDKFSILCSKSCYKVCHTCLTFETYNITCFWRDLKHFLPKLIRFMQKNSVHM